MIVRTFITPTGVMEAEQDNTSAIATLRMLKYMGIPVWTASVASPSGEMVVVFWTVTPTGKVITVMEHTMMLLDGTHAEGRVYLAPLN